MNIMHTMASEARTTQVPKRRFYSPELKLHVVQTCAKPGASIAGVALQNGINTNIVHRWIRDHSLGTLVVQPQAFIPVTLSTEPEPAPTKPVAVAVCTSTWSQCIQLREHAGEANEFGPGADYR